MGGGADQKQANAQLKSQQEYQSGQQKTFDTRNASDLDSSKAKGDDLYNALSSGYKSLIDPSTQVQAGSSGGGGGYNRSSDPRNKEVEDKYRNFMNTGGYTDDEANTEKTSISGLSSMGQTGGYDDAAKARARGNGVYDEFSKTGGYSDADLANIRSRGNSVVASQYADMANQAANQRSVQGGYGPGAAALMSRLARQNVATSADAVRDTEIGIKDKVNQGREWGAAGASSSELALQDQINKNKIAGLTGAADEQTKYTESRRAGEQYGLEGIKSIADQQAAEANAASSAAASNDWRTQQFQLAQKEAGLEGLSSLYGSSPEEYQQNKQLQLASAGQYGGDIGTLAEKQKTGNKSAWDTVAQIGGAVAGGAVGAMSGGVL